MSPLLVERTYMPKPFLTSGRSEDEEYLLKLGLDILLISLIAGASFIYLSEMLKESLPSNEIFLQEAR